MYCIILNEIFKYKYRVYTKSSQRFTSETIICCSTLGRDFWKFHHDNTPAHIAYLVTRLLVRSKVPTVPHTSYRPNVTPPD